VTGRAGGLPHRSGGGEPIGRFRWWPVMLAMTLPFAASLLYFVLFSEAAWSQGTLT